MIILVDQNTRQLSKVGGVRRYFSHYLPLLKKINPNIQLINTSAGKHSDIFHSIYYTTHRNKKIPQVVTVYDMIHELFPEYFPGIKNSLFRRKKKRVIQSADAVICISKNTQHDLFRFYKLDRDKTHVIYPGVGKPFKKIIDQKIKQKFFKKRRLGKPFLLYVGHRGRYKNFLTLVNAYASWSENRKIDLVTVGGIKFTPQEKNLFNRLGLASKIHNFQSISDHQLALFYNCAYAFIFPSLYEGFGLPLIEAMACGTLVLASNKSSFPEIGQDSILYFEPENVTSITGALNKSLSEDKKEKLIRKGLVRAKYFSWEKTARQTLKVYQQLIQSD